VSNVAGRAGRPLDVVAEGAGAGSAIDGWPDISAYCWRNGR
jgi:hypothetical protein